MGSFVNLRVLSDVIIAKLKVISVKLLSGKDDKIELSGYLIEIIRIIYI